ncbi:hypothetical protein [Arcticibacter eurypsychrophilus]|uniref:hypothetical protein n=1 Tax=Arcticibacter eurypsychrophilus TaxID=1434752 RepID=UPI00084DCF05|nr:hypothetical protein [Arcticibacter eurypsychrophilus]
MNTSEIASQDFIHFQEYLYVKGMYLADHLKIPQSIIDTGAQAYLSMSSTEWKHILHQGYKWFDYKSIPIEILIKYQVPSQEELIAKFKKSLSTEAAPENKLYQNEMLAIQIALNNADLFIPEFTANSIRKEKIASYCNSYAVLLLLQQFTHLKVYEQFNIYLAVSDSNFSFQTRSLNHFYAKTKDIKKYGLLRSLLHQGISNRNAVKMFEYHEKLISHFTGKGKSFRKEIFAQM